MAITVTEPKKWAVELGATADVNEIPETTDTESGLASMTALFPQLTALPLDAGGQAPQREDFNGLYKLIGQWVRFYMYGGVPSWTSSAAYPAGSLCSYNNSTWTALRASTNIKPAEGAYWHALTYYYSPASLQADLLNKVYPVGSIYMSVVNISPASFLGGTWQAIEQGRMLMAAGSSWQAGTTGGAAYHALTVQEMPAHDHSATETAAGAHAHNASTGTAGAHAHSGSALEAGAHAHDASTGTAGAHAHSGSALEAGAHAHSGSALEAGAHAHDASTGTAGAHAHSGSALEAGAHAHNASTGTAGSHDHALSMGTAGAHDHGGNLRTAGDGGHSHGGTTDYAGSHSHTRGSMNITGSFSGVGDVGAEPSYSGAFYKTGERSVPISDRGDPDYVTGFDASRSWTGSTSTEGSHSHGFSTSWAGEHSHWLSISSAGAHTHSVAIAAAGAHTHAITIGKTGSGAAFSILPPYIAVYMWRRTA